jgi:hypothetical protein
VTVNFAEQAVLFDIPRVVVSIIGGSFIKRIMVAYKNFPAQINIHQ